ncbi:hypothetical protein MBLNU457_5648t1 [Dothideomycetes sp. NU457]
MDSFYVGQRLSNKGQLCTVRYVGAVTGKSGEWLGVEWDNASRGKHNGTFEGVKYFQCRAPLQTAASFIRATAASDSSRSFLQALREKYVSDGSATGQAGSSTSLEGQKTVFISGKEVEELGYDKISRRQAQLHDLRIAIVDDMMIAERSKPADPEATSLSDLLPNLLELDLSRNLYEDASVVLQMCIRLPSIKTLTLDGNRLRHCTAGNLKCPSITSLNLNSMLIFPEEVADLVQSFPSLQYISISGNLVNTNPSVCNLPDTLSTVVAEDCKFEGLSQAIDLVGRLPALQSLGLKNNVICQIKTAHSRDSKTDSPKQRLPASLHTLDISGNDVSTWDFVDELLLLAPGLEHLRISNNPIYTTSKTPSGKSLSESEVSSLVIARLPNLKTLNFSTVTGKERLNGEKLYLSLAAEEIASKPDAEEADVIRKYPRYRELCEEYGEPAIQRRSKNSVDPNSLAARLIKCHFSLQGGDGEGQTSSIIKEITLELPKSLSVYSVFGFVGKRIGILPKDLSLIWETGEKDPMMPAIKGKQGVQEWDSEDEDDGHATAQWVDRETELVPGTRAIGTVIERPEARIKVLVRGNRHNELET